MPCLVLAAKPDLRLLAETTISGGGAARPLAGAVLRCPRRRPMTRDRGYNLTRRTPDERKLADLDFACGLVRHVKSSAIGAGPRWRQRRIVGHERVQARLAVQQAGDKAAWAVCASDAFFPFADGVEGAPQAGVSAVIWSPAARSATRTSSGPSMPPARAPSTATSPAGRRRCCRSAAGLLGRSRLWTAGHVALAAMSRARFGSTMPCPSTSCSSGPLASRPALVVIYSVALDLLDDLDAAADADSAGPAGPAVGTGRTGRCSKRTRRVRACSGPGPVEQRNAPAWTRVIIQRLRDPLLFSMRDQVADDIARQLQRRRFRRHVIIFHQGDPATRCTS